MTALAKQLQDACNKFTKWRTVFAAWQLGTRAKEDPECEAVRDHRELSMLMRAEISALTALLLEHKVCTQEQLQMAILTEVQMLDRAYQKRFPGFQSRDYGIEMNIALASDTMRTWRP